MDQPVDPFDLVSRALDCDRAALSEESAMYRNHGWDSLGCVNIKIAIEREYGIVVDDSQAGRLKSMRGVLKLCEPLLKGRTSDE